MAADERNNNNDEKRDTLRREKQSIIACTAAAADSCFRAAARVAADVRRIDYQAITRVLRVFHFVVVVPVADGRMIKRARYRRGDHGRH